MTLKLNFVAASDCGLVRNNNEDSAYAGPHLLVLADGMGGHAAGEIASQLMVAHMAHLDKTPGDADMLALLGAAADDANASIQASVNDNPEQEGMGTTLTALMFNGDSMGLIHVGDSRGYMLRGGTLTQITEDDTFVQSLVNEGKLAAEDVSSHPQKSLILKAYTGRPVEPRLEMLEIQPGDRFLLCSDGLSDPVTASTIEEALRQGTPELAAQRLIELALRSGGPDNITVVVADVVASDGSEAPSLPTSPVIAGALVPDHESTHPDSAASRAAALMRAAEVPEPLAEANTAQLKGMKAQRDRGNAVAAPVAAEIPADDEEPLRKRTVWPWVAGALALVLAGAGVVAWLNSRAEDTYTVAANGNNEIAIQRVSGSLFSSSEPTDFQLACINSHNELRIAAAGDMPQDCTVFTVDDLPPAQQSALENFSGGSYDEAVGLMNRLADAALPVCVEEKAEEKATEKADKESSASETTTCRTES